WSPDVCYSYLPLNCLNHFLRREIVGGKPVGLKPDTHAVFAASERLNFRHAPAPLHAGDEIDLDVILKECFIVKGVLRFQRHKHQKAALLLLCGDPGFNNLLRDLVTRFGYAILYVYRSDNGLHSLLEVNIKSKGAVVIRIVGQARHAFHADHGLLNRRSHVAGYAFGDVALIRSGDYGSLR